MYKILVIYHGAKIPSNKVDEWKSILLQNKYSVDVLKTEKTGDAHLFSMKTDYDLILAMGGDGTINEVVNGMKASESNAKFSFVPIGTGNDFNRSFNGIRSPKQLIEALANNKFLEMDLIKLSSPQLTRYCCNISDVGLGGLVVKHVERFRLKKSRNAYFKAIIKGFKEYAPSKVTLTINEERMYYSPLLVIFANGNYFGKGIGIAPDASIDNNLINVTIIDKVSVLTYLKFLPKLKKGRKIQDDRVTYTSARRVEINAGSLMYEVDGESVEFEVGENVIVEVQPRALKILISK